jgi:hypothetical protein
VADLQSLSAAQLEHDYGFLKFHADKTARCSTAAPTSGRAAPPTWDAAQLQGLAPPRQLEVRVIEARCPHLTSDCQRCCHPRRLSDRPFWTQVLQAAADRWQPGRWRLEASAGAGSSGVVVYARDR